MTQMTELKTLATNNLTTDGGVIVTVIELKVMHAVETFRCKQHVLQSLHSNFVGLRYYMGLCTQHFGI